MNVNQNIGDTEKTYIKNLDRSFELLNTVLELKLAYLKKMHPRMKEDELISKIHLDVIKDKELQWNLQKI